MAEIGIFIAYGLLIIAVASILIGFILTLVHDFKSGALGLVGLVGIGAIFLIAYLIAPESSAGSEGFSANTTKLVSGGLGTFYVLLVVTIAVLVLDLIRNIFQGN